MKEFNKLNKNTLIKIYSDDEIVQETVVWALNATGDSNFIKDSHRTGLKNDNQFGLLERFLPSSLVEVKTSEYILSQIETNKKIYPVRDLGIYDTKVTSFPSDLLGIRINDKTLQFCYIEDGKWKMSEKYPQLEIKSFKKGQKFISLENQGYDNKYLIFVETNFKRNPASILFYHPYLKTVPENVLNNLVKNENDYIENYSKHSQNVKVPQLDNAENDNEIGSLSLLNIIKTPDFIKAANCLEENEDPECFGEIREKRCKSKQQNIPLSFYCSKMETSFDEEGNENGNYYRFNEKWRLIKTAQKNEIRKPSKTRQYNTLDFQGSNIDEIELIKVNKHSIFIHTNSTTKPIVLNNQTLKPNTDYEIKMETFQRSGTQQKEYFIDKKLLDRVNSSFEECIEKLQLIIDNY